MRDDKIKALILCAGKGTRLRPLTYSMPKHLIPVANKPILDYALEKIEGAGIREIGFVLSPETGQEIEERYGPKFNYIYQEKPLGIAHAVKVARPFLNDDSFLLFLGDNLLEEDFHSGLDDFLSSNLDALIYLKEVLDPKRFGVAVIDEEGKMVRVIEKPPEPPSPYAIIGLYFFSPVVHKAIDSLRPSWRNEYEITDAIQFLVENGFKVKGRIARGFWLDTGKKEDLIEANRLLLDLGVQSSLKGEIKESKISGRVTVEEGAVVEKSEIRGPAIIGKDARIENSLIEPFTSIGDGCLVRDSVISNCILMREAQVVKIPRLESSIVGRRAKIIQEEEETTFLKLHVGDETEVRLGNLRFPSKE